MSSTPPVPNRSRSAHPWLLYVLALVAAAPILLPADARAEDVPSLLRGLPDWFFGLVLDAARWQWIALGLLILITAPISNLVRAILHKLLESRYERLQGLRDSDSGSGIQRSASFLVAALLWTSLFPILDLPDKLDRLFRLIIQGVAVIGVVWLVYSIWDAICDSLAGQASLEQSRTRRLLVPIMRKFVEAGILGGGLLLALASYGVNVTGVVAGLGIGGLIIALAAKDSVENIFGSFTILFDMPFAIGDWVKIGTVEGSVEEINLRSTRIRTSEDSVITLPNSNLIRASVENLGVRRHHRVKTTLSVSANLSSPRIAELLERIRAIIKGHPQTRKTGYQVEVFEFTLTEIHILVNFFIKAATYTEELRHRGELLMEFKKAAEEMGIESLSAPQESETGPETDSAVPKTAEQEAAPDPSHGL